MNSNLTFICKAAAEYLLSGGIKNLDPCELELDSDIPIWDDLTFEEKIKAIKYVVKNKNDEDFGHSGCCRAVHQATAYFLVEYFQSLDSEVFFDDLDFMMADNVPSKPIAAMFGIGGKFFE